MAKNQLPEIPTELKADWSYWWQVEVVTVDDAIALSLGIDPNFSTSGFAEGARYMALIYPYYETFEKYKEEVIACIGKKNGLIEVGNPNPNIPSGIPSFNLRAFGSWARNRKGWKLPKEFPYEFTSPSITTPYGMNLHFPHRCRFIEVLTYLAAEHYTVSDKKNPPKQGLLAERISNELDIDLRVAKTIAARLKPDKKIT